MPHSVDNQFDAYFDDLRRHLLDSATLNPAGGALLFYFVYPPEHILTMRQLLRSWIGRLHNEHNLAVRTLSLSELLWELVDASGRWEQWLEFEAMFDQEQANEAIRDVLRSNNALVERIARAVESLRPDTVLFILDVECLHPYFRTRAIENHIHDRVRIPTVFFYPGRRVGQYGLHFLNFHAEDAGYRSPIIGGPV